MSRAMKSRLGKLEAAHQGPSDERVHVTLGRTDAEHERQLEAKRASGEYREGDRVLQVRFVKPGEVAAAGEDPDQDAAP